jgi:Uncharacterized flagellar protein FlaG
MVDSISSNMAAGLPVPANTPAPTRPEPAVQVTGAAEVRNGGDAARGQGNLGGRANAPQNTEEAFEEINAAMQAWNTGMRFEIDEDTQKLVVSVVDTQSGEVLRQIPSEEVLHVAKIIAQFQGNKVSTKA